MEALVGSKCFCNSGFSFNCVLIYSDVFCTICQVDTYPFCGEELKLQHLTFFVVRKCMLVKSSVVDKSVYVFVEKHSRDSIWPEASTANPLFNIPHKINVLFCCNSLYISILGEIKQSLQRPLVFPFNICSGSWNTQQALEKTYLL